MRIKTVRWAQLKSGPGYENRQAGVEIEVNEGESAEAAINEAKKVVHHMLHESGDGNRSPATNAEMQAIEEAARKLAEQIADARVPF